MSLFIAKLKTSLSLLFSFQEDTIAFGVPMRGKVKKDLYIFILACTVGMFFSVLTGFPGSSPVFSAFLRERLGLSNTLYSVFLALPYIGTIIQIPFAAFIRKYPHVKSFYIGFSLFCRLSFALIGITALILKDENRQVVIAIILCIQALNSFAWWIGDLCFGLWSGQACPVECNGRFFSTRQMSFTAAQLVYSFLLTFLMNALKDNAYQYIIMFSLAALFGSFEILSFIFVKAPTQQKLEKKVNTVHKSTSIFAPFKDKNYRVFLLFVLTWAFAGYIASPFQNIFMLEQLQIPLSRQTIYNYLVPAISTVLFIRVSGRMSDRYGYRNTLLLMSSLSAANSLLWIITIPQTEFFLPLLFFWWGTTGTATDLLIFSMGIYLAPGHERATYLSAKTVFANLLGVTPAILLGGIFSDWIQPILREHPVPFLLGQNLTSFHILNTAAVLIRIMGILCFARYIKADRELGYKDFLRTLKNALLFRFKLKTGLLNRRSK